MQRHPVELKLLQRLRPVRLKFDYNRIDRSWKPVSSGSITTYRRYVARISRINRRTYIHTYVRPSLDAIDYQGHRRRCPLPPPSRFAIFTIKFETPPNSRGSKFVENCKFVRTNFNCAVELLETKGPRRSSHPRFLAIPRPLLSSPRVILPPFLPLSLRKRGRGGRRRGEQEKEKGRRGGEGERTRWGRSERASKVKANHAAG